MQNNGKQDHEKLVDQKSRNGTLKQLKDDDKAKKKECNVMSYDLNTPNAAKNALLVWKSHVCYFRKLRKFPTMFHEKVSFISNNCKNNLIRKNRN